MRRFCYPVEVGPKSACRTVALVYDPRPPFKPGNRSSLAVGGAWFSSFLAVFLFAVSASVSATLWICLWLEACECCNEYYMLLYDFYILRAVQMFTSCLNSWYQ